MKQDNSLILVDSDDNVLGHETKEQCHRGEGILHRAFSVFIFNSEKKLLIQKRGAGKPLWPLFWSNSVCSHPMPGENTHQAAQRRVTEELGIEAPLIFLFKFQYQARYKDIGSENELCAVFIGKTDAPISANPAEIAQWQYIDLPTLDRQLQTRPYLYTPWFQIEWQGIKKHHLKDIEKLFQAVIPSRSPSGLK